MTQRSVELTEELDAFVSNLVAGGHYADASEVVRDALQKMEEEDREQESKMRALRAAIEEGFASGICEENPFLSIREELGLPPRARRGKLQPL